MVAALGLMMAACAGGGNDADTSAALSTSGSAARDAALSRLKAKIGSALLTSNHKATGAMRSLRVAPGSKARFDSGPAKGEAEKTAHSVAFFRDYGPAAGVADPATLRLLKTDTDALRATHQTWKQYVGDVPVFGATLKTHFDAANRLEAVIGTAIPDLDVNPTPTWSKEQAAAVARANVVADKGDSDYLHVGTSTLYVYRQGLAQGVPGPNHLAWEIEITDDNGVRELVYVGAQTGKVIDRITGIQDDLYRRAYDGKNLPRVPDNYPNGPYWLEGQRLPTNSQEANNMIVASKETYDFYKNAFGRDSFDGKGAKMDAIFDRGYDCPNASWNGTFISFCPGLTTDDVTAHEWSHAYTEYTHHLIYAWQPGALNEAYSDIWGETVDLINGRGTDAPLGPRTAGQCSTFSPPVGTLRVTAPSDIAADYFAQSAGFGPALTTTGISAGVVAALDAADPAGPTTLDGCTAITNATAVAGKVALVNRGGCEFSTKVLNAQKAGAVAVLVANNAATGLPGMGAGVDAPSVTIPSLGVQQSTGDTIRTKLTAGTAVTATLLARPGADNSYRWLVGEDSVGGITGALRDMWNPTCYSNAGRVNDTAYYQCSTLDAGGVHSNSGVPNHGYALLVDGGTFNGKTIGAIGLTKAAQIYFRAESVYQVDDSDFADHADAIEKSCQDLIGKSFPALGNDSLNGPISANDCAQVATMTAAVEMRTPPTFCNFTPILDPRTAPTCSTGTTTGVTTPIASYTFESGADGFTVSHVSDSATFTPRDWGLVSQLPSGKAGSGFFGPTPNIGSCEEQNEAGVLYLTGPAIVLPGSTSFARATFEHWFALEPGYDGGNLQISVNNGAWQLVPPSELTFNNYFAFLFGPGDSTNPLAGQPAWTSVNNGSVSEGSWGRTHVNLGNFAKAGDTVRLRWQLGTDGCAGRTGWYVDNVNVFSCVPNVPDVKINDASVAEGNAGTKELVFTVSLSKPTIKAIVVTYATSDGTALHGNDYDPTAGTIVIPASTALTAPLSGQIRVPIKGDIVPEGDEALNVHISSVSFGTLTDADAVGTILDDDSTPPSP